MKNSTWCVVKNSGYTYISNVSRRLFAPERSSWRPSGHYNLPLYRPSLSNVTFIILHHCNSHQKYKKYCRAATNGLLGELAPGPVQDTQEVGQSLYFLLNNSGFYQSSVMWMLQCHYYIILTIPDICHFFTRAKFLENKIYTEKRQFFALNL